MKMAEMTSRRQFAFICLRLVAFASLMLTFLWRYVSGDLSVDLVWFSILSAIWFGLSLLLQNAGRADGRLAKGKCALFGMIDTYVIVSSFSLALHSPHACVSILGGYCLLVTSICGPVVGAVSVLAGLLAGLNSAASAGGSPVHVMIAGAVAFACGLAWYAGFPFLWHALSQYGRAGSAADVAPIAEAGVDSISTKLSDMQKRLTEISGERDKAQERVCELEVMLKSGGGAEDAGTAAVSEKVAAGGANEASPIDEAGAWGDRIADLEAKLDRSESELKASKFEQNNMASQLETMSKELEAAYSGAEETASPDADDDIAAAFAAVAEAKQKERKEQEVSE